MGSRTDASEAVQPMPDDAPPPSGGSATPVADDSYQHQYAGATGSALNQAIASPGHALVQRSQDIHALQAVARRLTSAVRSVEGAGPVMLVSVLVALSLGVAIRARRWLISHNRD
jgi:hypothetical protein